MNMGRMIVIIESACMEKLSVSKIVAENSRKEKSVHMRIADFYQQLSKGSILAHLPEAEEQNQIVLKAFLEAAKCYVQGGYDVIVEAAYDLSGSHLWETMLTEGYEIHYFILKTKEDVYKAMNDENHIFDASEMSEQETALTILDQIETKKYLLYSSQLGEAFSKAEDVTEYGEGDEFSEMLLYDEDDVVVEFCGLRFEEEQLVFRFWTDSNREDDTNFYIRSMTIHQKELLSFHHFHTLSAWGSNYAEVSILYEDFPGEDPVYISCCLEVDDEDHDAIGDAKELLLKCDRNKKRYACFSSSLAL